MNKHFSEFMTDFNLGQSGKAVNLPLTKHCNTDILSELGKSVNVTKGMYFMLGGMSGSGKTSICDSQFVLNIYMWWKRNREKTPVKPYWIYRSMERSIKYKVAKWTCWLMYIDYGILIDVPTILQWSNKKRELTEEELFIIRGYDKFFDELFQFVDIKQGAENPTGIRNYARNIAYQKGKYITSGSDGLFINGEKVADFNEEQVVVNKDLVVPYLEIEVYGKKEIILQYDVKYFPRNENEIVFHIADHVGKLASESRNGLQLNDKQILDKHYEYQGKFRDVFMWTPIDIVQLNRAIESHSRMRSYGKDRRDVDIDITNQDFKGSGDGYENADVVLGLLNPFKLNEMRYGGYNIDDFVCDSGENRFRAIQVVKNSYGTDDFSLGYCFVGENGFIVEIPKASEFTPNLYEDCRNAKIIIS